MIDFCRQSPLEVMDVIYNELFVSPSVQTGGTILKTFRISHIGLKFGCIENDAQKVFM